MRYAVRLTIGMTVVAASLAGCVPDNQTVDAAAIGQRVEAYLAPWVARGDFRGVVRIARGDEIVVDASWGLGDDIDGAPGNSRFRIASLTKTMTAGAVLMLANDSVLSLDDSIARYFPELDSTREITVRHLLAHSSGVAPADEALYFRDDLSLGELVADISARPLQFEPGSQHQYSNAGYNLLARVIELETGTGYEQHLRDAVFEPLGMSDTGHYFDDGVAAGMRPGPGPTGVRPALPIQFAAATGSGSLASTLDDLHRWALAVARDTLFSYDDLEWPFGWGKIEAGGERGLEQTGAMTGVTSSIAVFPDSEIVVIVLNAVEASDWTRWNQDLVAIAFGEEVTPPTIPMPAARDIDAQRLVGRYRDGGTTIRVGADDGLELYWDDWPHGRYLMPLDDDAFLSRTSGGLARFEPGTGPAQRLVMRWGDYEQSFERVAE